jgi:outer membrane lipoprotein-sorting protein
LKHKIPSIFTILAISAAPLFGDPVADALARMDRNAQVFKGCITDIRKIAHNAAVDINDEVTGKMWVKRPTPRDLRVKIEFGPPKPETVVLEGTTASIYYPSAKIVQVYEVGKNKQLFEQFFLLGFGGSGKDLANSYEISALPPEKIGETPTTHLQLVPKSPDVLKNIRKVELWLSDVTGYPAQQKLYQPSGDYIQVTYTNLQVNPNIPDSALKLKLPKGVQIQHPQQ